MKIAILYICTGKYNQFFKGFYESSEKYFLKGIASVEYFVFTDDMSLSSARNVHLIKRKCQGFPLDSLLRFEMFLEIKEQLELFDYIYFFNANAELQRPIGREILPDETGLAMGAWPGKREHQHPMFFPYERNKKSNAYYVFGKIIMKREVYIKVKIQSYDKKIILCMSFHFAPFMNPLRDCPSAKGVC